MLRNYRADFYRRHFSLSKVLSMDSFTEEQLEKEAPRLVLKQWDLYDKKGKYERRGVFYTKEINPYKTGFKADSAFQDLVRGRAKLSKLMPVLLALPVFIKKRKDLESEFYLNHLNVLNSLTMGANLTEHQECYNFLLNIFSSFEESGEVWNDLKVIAKKILDGVEIFSEMDVDEDNCSLYCYEKYLDLNILQTDEKFLNNYIARNCGAILKDSYKSAEKKNIKPFNQAVFMKNLDPEGDSWDEDSEWEAHYRNLYQQFVNGNRIPKDKWFIIIKELVKLESNHSKEVCRRKEIKTALEMGASALGNIPNLMYPFLLSMQRISNSCFGKQFLEQLSKELIVSSENYYESIWEEQINGYY